MYTPVWNDSKPQESHTTTRRCSLGIPDWYRNLQKAYQKLLKPRGFYLVNFDFVCGFFHSTQSYSV